MPRHCSVYGCYTNYDGRKRASTFTLPKTEPLRSLWLMQIPTDLSKLKKPYICIDHFKEEDIITTDTVPYKGVMRTFPRKLPKLREGAFPCIFPVIPDFMKDSPGAVSYISVNEKGSSAATEVLNEYSQKNSINCSEGKRVQKESINCLEDICIQEKSINSLENISVQEKSINCLEDISVFFKEKFDVGDKWTLLKHDSKMILCLNQGQEDIPAIVGNITVNENLEFSVFVGKAKMTKLPFKDECTTLKSFSVLEQLIQFIEEQVNTLGQYVYFLDKLINS